MSRKVKDGENHVTVAGLGGALGRLERVRKSKVASHVPQDTASESSSASSSDGEDDDGT